MVAEMMTKTTRILIACLLDFSIYLLIISNIYDHEKYVDNDVTILAGTVTFGVGLWFYASMEALGPFEYAVAIAVAVVVSLAW